MTMDSKPPFVILVYQNINIYDTNKCQSTNKKTLLTFCNCYTLLVNICFFVVEINKYKVINIEITLFKNL